MTSKFEDVMAQRTDADLLKIVSAPLDDYQPEAVEAAKQELAKRNLSYDQLAATQQEVEDKQRIRTEKANEPLGFLWKVLTFLLPGLLTIVLSGLFKADGYDRKASDLTKWTLYGFGFYLGIIILIIIVV